MLSYEARAHVNYGAVIAANIAYLLARCVKGAVRPVKQVNLTKHQINVDTETG